MKVEMYKKPVETVNKIDVINAINEYILKQRRMFGKRWKPSEEAVARDIIGIITSLGEDDESSMEVWEKLMTEAFRRGGITFPQEVDHE